MADTMLDLSPIDPPTADPRKKRAQTIGQMLLQKGADTSPISSPWVGVARMATSALGGYLEGQEERKQQALLEEGNKAQGSVWNSLAGGSHIGSGAAAALPGTPSSTPSVKASSFDPKSVPSFVAMAGQPYGVSPDFMTKTAWIESKGNPNAVSPTGAKGTFQFTGGTAKAMGLADPFDPVASADAAARLASQNRGILQSRLGRDPSDAELYLAHQQGAAGASALLANPNVAAADALSSAYKGDRSAAARAIRVNGGDPEAPASSFSGMWTGRYNALSPKQAMAVPGADQGGVPAAMPTDNRPAWAYPVGNEPGAFQPQTGGRTAEADLPMQGATPISYDAMGGYTPDGQDDGGFFIPPGPATGGGGLSMQPEPDMPAPAPPGPLSADLMPAAMGSIPIPGGAPAPVMGADLGTDPTSVPGMYAPPAQVVTGSDIPGMPPAGSFGAPIIPTMPGDPNAGAPLPPARPDQSALVAAAPLPPSRPDFANIPDAGARQTTGQQLGRALLAQPPAMPDMGNFNDGGAGVFARTNGGADPQALAAALSNSRPGQGGTSGDPSPRALALARVLQGQPAFPASDSPSTTGSLPSATTPPGRPATSSAVAPGSVLAPGAATAANGAAGQPTNILPPSVSGGPAAGPTGPGGSGEAPTHPTVAAAVQNRPAIGMAEINALANSPSPVHQAMAKAVFENALRGRETAVIEGHLVDKQSGAVIFKAPEKPYTMNQGDTRFDGNNRVVAQGQPKDDRTTDQKNYDSYVAQENSAGRTPLSLNNFIQQHTQRQGQAVTVKDANGNERTLFYEPITSRLKTPEEMGAPAAPGQTNPYAPSGKVTEDQGKASGFATRMANSHGIINSLEHVGTGAIEQGLANVPGGNYLLSTGKQQLLQAQSDFINSILRRESGAAIGKDEFTKYGKQYFPQPGDSPEVIAQKRASREDAIEGTMAAAGPNYRVPDSYQRTPKSTAGGGGGGALLQPGESRTLGGATIRRVR